tara:strand:+ start:413 stop:862 length:450 start_codon:yes stop_codon:yes gene_type:complete
MQLHSSTKKDGKTNMKDVTTIIKQGQKASWKDSKESQAKPGDDEKEQMTYLFGLLTIEYPFFTPKSDEDLLRKVNMWCSMLRNYGRTERMEALQKCFKHYKNKGGPSVGEFLELLKTDPAHKAYKALPLPEAKKSIVQAELEKMRNILR